MSIRGVYIINRPPAEQVITCSGEELLEPGDSLDDPVPAVEGADPDEPLAAGSEPAARHGDDVRLLEDLREHVPRLAPGEPHPHVRRVGAAVHLLPERRERLHQQPRVLLVHADHAAHGGPAFLRRYAGEAAGLRDAGRAVEASADDTVEVARHGAAVRVPELVGHHRPAEADAREPSELGEGRDLDGHLPRAGHLVDGPRLALRHVPRVRRVEHDDGAVPPREVHQLAQLRRGRHVPRRVVGRAEEDHVGAWHGGEVREEGVLRRAPHVSDARVLAGLVGLAGLPHDHAVVHVPLRSHERTCESIELLHNLSYVQHDNSEIMHRM
jgi:hypothetical protein